MRHHRTYHPNKILSVLLVTFFILAILHAVAPGTAQAATFWVTNRYNSGAGSLRAAIEAANATPLSTDTINFNIAGSQRIEPTSALPTITGPVVIDGTSEPDFRGRPIVEISGRLAGDSHGLYITGGGSTVRGLVINRFQKSGIRIEGSGGNTIRGNYLGTDVVGTADLGNTVYGLELRSSSANTIGGTSAAARNVISGNDQDGVYLYQSSKNLIRGNYLGTDAGGGTPLGNGNHGILIDNVSTRNEVGGTSASARNVISGNVSNGVYIRYLSSLNVVRGNCIGTDHSGTAAVGNGWSGVSISVGSDSNTIGGTSSSARNVIAGNGHYGISIHYASPSNKIQGNNIGLASDGSALGNAQHGIYISNLGGINNSIGGTAAGAGNAIACNGQNGVEIRGDQGNSVLGNSIFRNAWLGIDLGGDGGTPNDAGDEDTGPNSRQNYPVITSVISSETSAVLNSRPSTTFRVEFFSDDTPDTCGFGQGRTFLGFATVTTDETGTARFSVPFGGNCISATATDPEGNTSEFGGGKSLGATSWSVPEGSTGGGFDTWILIQNPGAEPADVSVRFTTEQGPREPVWFQMPPASRTTVRVADYVPDDYSVSGFVASTQPVVVERSMYWDRNSYGDSGVPGSPQPYQMKGGHANLGVPGSTGDLDPRDQGSTCYFPEGSTAAGFDTWILLANPAESDTTAIVSLMTTQGQALEREVSVPALSRRTVHLDDLLPGQAEVSTEVRSPGPLVAERSMYWDPAGDAIQPFQMRGGHSSGGSRGAFREWFLAEGSTGGGFETYVLLQNPQQEEAAVTVDFMDASGVAASERVTMPPRTRRSLKIADYVPDEFQVSTRVNSDKPIVAERSMYWDKRTAASPSSMRGGHATMGFRHWGSMWMVPEGSTGGGFDSWVLVSNPTESDVLATVTFMTGAGSRGSFDVGIKAESRYTIHVNDYVPGEFGVSTRIQADGVVVVERAMYWDRNERAGIQPYEMMGGHSASGF
jgi:hypothetical protein